jgi:hypothetical protein
MEYNDDANIEDDMYVPTIDECLIDAQNNQSTDHEGSRIKSDEIRNDINLPLKLVYFEI